LREQAINDFLIATIVLKIPLLRREMIECKMLTRTLDGREYRRVERKPPTIALALIRFLREK